MRQSKYQNDDFRFEYFMNNQEEIMNRHNSNSNQNSTKKSTKGATRGIIEEVFDPNLPASHKRTRITYVKCVQEWVKNSENENDSCEGKFPSYTKYDINGNLLEQRFHKDGKAHSFEDRPAFLQLNPEGEILKEEWKENGKWKVREHQQPNSIVYENGEARNTWFNKNGKVLPKPKSFVVDKDIKQPETVFKNQTTNTAPVSHSPHWELTKIEIDSAQKFLEHFKLTGDPNAFYKSMKYMSSIGSDMGLYNGEHTAPFIQPSLH